jgi:hypothetical protein
MTIHEKLMEIQQRLNCPKGRENTFNTTFMYRSNSDILAAVKPIIKELKCVVLQSDSLVEMCGSVYVVATSTLQCTEDPTQSIAASAYARENPSRKGMDPSQLTGGASSYARKYSLNGLFAIDDVQDADTQNNNHAPQPQPPRESPDKAACLSMIMDNQEAIDADPQLKAYVDACESDGFYTDCLNNLKQRFGGNTNG